MKINCFIIHFIFVSFVFIIKSANAVFDVDFYNVGQGHCVIARSTKNGILIIDAGSSSTIGIKEITRTTGKNDQLATQIFSSITDDLKKGQKLSLIITHADKDHLNLVKPILNNVLNLNLYKGKTDTVKSNIKAIFGGNKDDYSSKESKNLLKFIEKNKISFTFGSDFIENKSTLLWDPPKEFTFDSSDLQEKVEFLSVNRTVKKMVGEKRSLDEDEDYEDPSKENEGEEDTNASSIVIKITGGGGGHSVMITGDKTISEIGTIIGKYRKASKLAYLKSDVFLATHHGSEKDFSASWMKQVNPSYLVVSAGTSSFFHPRPEAVLSNDIIKHLAVIPDEPWHPIRAYGDLLLQNKSLNPTFHSDKRLIPFASGNTDNYRSTPYSYSMTSYGIYVTADQGTIKFSFDPKLSVTLTEKGNPDFEKSLTDFVIFQKSNLTKLIINPSIKLSSLFIKSTIIPCTSLVSLDLSKCTINDEQGDDIITIINQLSSLSNLDISNNKLDKNKQKIKDAWNHRGLKI